MKIKSNKTTDTDRLILVSSEKLMQYANEIDLQCRNAERVENAYHKDWFFEEDGCTYFTPPAAYIEDGEIFFINGRHRAILLARHLDQFPFLIGNIDLYIDGEEPKESSLKVFDSIKVGNFKEYSTFSLPDLDFGDFEPA
jgi:hypothetical protein